MNDFIIMDYRIIENNEEETPKRLVLTSSPLTMGDLIAIANGQCYFDIPTTAMQRVAEGRRVFLSAMQSGQAIYGATTGVGAMKTKTLNAENSTIQLETFHRTLPLAHQVATGEALPASVSRLTMALRLNTALSGAVGVSESFITLLFAMLKNDLLPILHRRGSVGCADLGQMGELAAVMSGHGETVLRGEKMPAAAAFKKCHLSPHMMPARDGLAAVASNSYGVGFAALVISHAAFMVRRAMLQGLASAQALGLDRYVWQTAVFIGQAVEREVAQWMLTSYGTAGDKPRSRTVHDPLSGRMLVQILAGTLSAVAETTTSITEASAQIDDNPIVYGNRVVTSGGSLLVTLGLRLAMVQNALSLLGRNILNRCQLLCNGQIDGLPVNLVPENIIATGYGPLMKLAMEQSVRIAAESGPLPRLAQTLSAGLEDEAMLIPLTVEKISSQLDALEWLLAIEAILVSQALDLQQVEKTPIASKLYQVVRTYLTPLQQDIPLSQPLGEIHKALRQSNFLTTLLDQYPLEPFDTELGLIKGSKKTTQKI